MLPVLPGAWAGASAGARQPCSEQGRRHPGAEGPGCSGGLDVDAPGAPSVGPEPWMHQCELTGGAGLRTDLQAIGVYVH